MAGQFRRERAVISTKLRMASAALQNLIPGEYIRNTSNSGKRRLAKMLVLKLAGWCAILCGASAGLWQSVPIGRPGTSAERSIYIPHLTFDVASIHEAREGDFSYIDNVPKTSLYRAERVPLWGFIMAAYDVKIANLLTNVPDWAMRTRYDVSAKSDSSSDEALGKLSDSDFRAEKRHMLQELLSERFHLQIHAATRVSTTYDLVATARAAKRMSRVDGDLSKTVSTCAQHFSRKGTEIQSTGCPFPILLSQLQQNLGTKITDRTGITGVYAYHLMWDPSLGISENDEERYPHLIEAIRDQLGLELKATKSPVTVWVVDHLERPTPN